MPSAQLPPGLHDAVTRRLLVCPLCAGVFDVRDRSLVCPKAHTFDVARQGHVHLAPGHKAPASYDRKLMEARAAVVAHGFFDPLLGWCQSELPRLGAGTVFLDAGCGEGSFLTRLCAAVPGALGVGIDLAPDGVRMAAARSKAQAWCVADLAAIPAADRSFSAVLNVLSPANYREFQRVLAPGGLLVKAAPTARHLRELRSALRGDDYSNEPVIEQFRAFFPNAGAAVVEAAVPCGPAMAEAFLSMTPLGWHASEAQRQAFVAAPPAHVTVSLEVLWARAE